MLSYKRIILVGLWLFCMSSFAGDAAIDSLTEGELKEMRERYKTLQNKAILDGTVEEVGEFLKYHNLVLEKFRKAAKKSQKYVPDLEDIHNKLQATSKGKDYFADSIEARSKGMVEIAEKIREIKKRNAVRIAIGDYEKYLDDLGLFLAGLKRDYPNPIDEALFEVNMLRGFYASYWFRADKKSDLKRDGGKDAK